MKGLHQGDPLSPMLFNIVVDMLAILIDRAKNDGQIAGIVPHLVDGGLSILQYVDALHHGPNKRAQNCQQKSTYIGNLTAGKK
jgi:hypothetical protein